MNGGMGKGERGVEIDRSMERGEIMATLFQKGCFKKFGYLESSVHKRYGDGTHHQSLSAAHPTLTDYPSSWPGPCEIARSIPR